MMHEFVVLSAGSGNGALPAVLVSLLFFLLCAGVFGVFIGVLVRAVKRSQENDQAPQLTMEAAIKSKRAARIHDCGRRIAVNEIGRPRMSYYATFQVQGGDEMELRVPEAEYGRLLEGTQGQLTLQGTRYLGFQRVNTEE